MNFHTFKKATNSREKKSGLYFLSSDTSVTVPTGA